MRRSAPFLLAISLLLCSSPTNAAEITGQVLVDGHPAVAKLELTTLEGRVLATVESDEDGDFELLGIETSPPWRLLVESAGAIRVVELGGASSELVLRLERAGFAGSTEVLAPSGAGERIEVQASELLTAESGIEALEATGQVARIGSGGITDTPSVRGVARNRVVTEMDGARISSFRRAGTSLKAVDPLLLEGLEIEASTRAAVAGSQAIGGVIGARTPSADSSFFRARAASVNDEIALAGAIPIAIGETVFGLAFAARHAGDLDTPIGTQSPAGYDRANLVATGSTDAGPGRLAFKVFGSWIDDLGRPRLGREDRPSRIPEAKLARLGLSWVGPAFAGFDHLDTGLTIGRRSEISTSERDGEVTQRADNSALDLDAHLIAYRSFGEHELAIGFDALATLDRDADVLTGTVASKPIINGRSTDLGLVLSDRWRFNEKSALELSLRGDLINDQVSSPSDAADQSLSSLTGRLRIERETGPVTLWSGLARAFRAPSLDERYFTGPTGRGTITGNPELQPEVGWTLEAGLELGLDNSRLFLTVFRTELDRPIERIEPLEDEFTWTNLDSSEIYGIELGGRIGLPHNWHLSFGATTTRGSAEDGAALADIAAPRLITSLEQRSRDYRLGAQLRALGSKKRPGPSEVEQPASYRFDLWYAFDLGEHYELEARIVNAFDEELWLSADRLAIPGPGRGLVLAIDWRP